MSTPSRSRAPRTHREAALSAVHAVTSRAKLCGVATLLAAFGGASLGAQQPLETETARLPLARTLLIQGTYEFQTSNQGIERAAPLAFEVGITDRFALLAEPVLYTSIKPNGGPQTTGVGDLEITGQFLVRQERSGLPALAIGAEVKVPTAHNSLIGTGRTDFTP